MVVDQVILGTALLGSFVAAAYDLRTTEVPNWVFYAMLAVGIPAVISKALIAWSFDVFALAGITGLGLFALGYAMYRLGQWGGADMVLLGLIGFLIPATGFTFPGELSLPFGVSFLINLFMIGAVYMIGYSVVVALRDRSVMQNFASKMKASTKILAVLSVSMFVLFSGLMLYLDGALGNVLTTAELIRGVAIPLALTVGFFVVYNFAKAVENFGFKKRIPVSKLSVGDMLLEERKLVGITEQQLRKIRRSGKRWIWVKEGVRFAPAFPIALLFTLYVGDAVMMIKILF